MLLVWQRRQLHQANEVSTETKNSKKKLKKKTGVSTALRTALKLRQKREFIKRFNSHLVASETEGGEEKTWLALKQSSPDLLATSTLTGMAFLLHPTDIDHRERRTAERHLERTPNSPFAHL